MTTRFYKSLKLFSLLVAMMLPSSPLPAGEAIRVSNAWVRATVPGQTTAAAYMDISAATGSTLVAAESPAARKMEFHSMTMEGSVMRMRALAKIDLPAGGTVTLKPGGYHLMLIDLNRQLKAGDRVAIKLTLTNNAGIASGLQLEVPVRAEKADSEPHTHGHGGFKH